MRQTPIRLICMIMAMFVLSAGAAFADPIFLKNRQFNPDPFDGPAQALANLAGRHGLIQLRETPNQAARQILELAGVHLLSPISGNTWLAYVDDAGYAKTKGIEGVLWTGDLLPEDKMALQVQQADFLPHSELESGNRALDVGFHADITETQARQVLAEFNAEVLDYAQSTNAFIAGIDEGQIYDLAQRDEVAFVGEPGIALTPMLDIAKPAVGGDVANAAPYGVTGAGIKAFILDGGTIADSGANAHQDLAGRVTQAGFVIPDIIGHPTHVGCIVGGSGALSGGQYVGVAPEVSIVSTSIIPSLSLPPMYDAPGNVETAYNTAVNNFGATVANNSIGSNLAQLGSRYCDKEGDYERSAQTVDAVFQTHDEQITIVWANGNERGNNDGACGNNYFTTAPPATAKNPIAVGAVNKEDLSMTEFSSWGPTDDGRLRPDVSAPGCSTGNSAIMSCSAGFSGGDYVGFCGTSMACPMVTGGVALMQQYWKEKNSSVARAATFKAITIHGAKEIDDEGPDYVFGYGVMDIPASLDLIDNAVIIEDEVDQGDTYSIALTTTGDPIKATLVWSDVPGERLAAKVLVNDLDLTVETGNGTELPWVLDPANPADDAIKGENHRDPTEQVEFTLSGKASIDVVVTGSDVPSGPQKFSLVVTGAYDPNADDDDDDNDTDDDTSDDDTVDDDDTSDDDSADGGDDDDDDDDGCGC